VTASKELAEILPKLSRIRVGVIGDLMLDRYIWGKASRISQEAPVPVVQVLRETSVPGGAANVVRNIASLGGHAVAFGVVGDDRHADTLTDLLAHAGADVTNIIRTDKRPTTLKTRVLANNQQVVRVDREDTSAFGNAIVDRLRASALAAIENEDVDAIIFEDYAKGLLTAELIQELVNCARTRGIVTGLDPHPSHPFDVRGLTLMTPNRAEAFGLAGVYYRSAVLPVENDAPLLDVGALLLDRWEVNLLLVTMGGAGMALFHTGDKPVHIPTRAREVFDVSGAGDTVMASLVLALSAGATPVQAAEFANHAAGIAVGKIGTVAVEADELARDLMEAE